MIGKTFGRLTVIAKAQKPDNLPKGDRHLRWHCLCSCGNKRVVRGKDLRRGHTLSCGCLRKEINIKHGDTYTRLYKIWLGMRNRCNNKNNKSYHHYGERGITYSPTWDDYEEFKQWALSSGYTDDLTLERIDVDKDYSEYNCTWADRATQSANRRKRPNTSFKYIGVCKLRSGKWQASITINYKTYYLGLFDTELEAAQFRDNYIKTHNLPHKLNF